MVSRIHIILLPENMIVW